MKDPYVSYDDILKTVLSQMKVGVYIRAGVQPSRWANMLRSAMYNRGHRVRCTLSDVRDEQPYIEISYLGVREVFTQ